MGSVTLVGNQSKRRIILNSKPALCIQPYSDKSNGDTGVCIERFLSLFRTFSVGWKEEI